MKKYGFYTLLILSVLLPATAFAQPNLKVSAADNEAIQSVSKNVTARGTIHFREGLIIAPESFLEENKIALGLTSHDEMREHRRASTKVDGEEIVRFHQFHQGIPVEGAEYVMRSEQGALATLKGRIAEGLDLDAATAMNEDEALTAALRFVEADIYAWEIPEPALQKTADLDSVLPKSELIIVRDPKSNPDHPEYLLTWRTEIKVSQPAGHWLVYTDAVTGNFVKKLSGRHEASNATGTVHTLYNGTHSFSTRKRGFPNNDYILRDKTRGEITTKQYSSFDFWGWGLAGHIDQGSNTWSRSEATAHWAAQESHDYFKNVHGRSGVNGSNEEIRVLANGNGTYYSDDGEQILHRSGNRFPIARRGRPRVHPWRGPPLFRSDLPARIRCSERIVRRYFRYHG